MMGVQKVRKSKGAEKFAMLPILSVEREYGGYTLGGAYRPVVKITFQDFSPFHYVELLFENGKPYKAQRKLAPARVKKRNRGEKRWPLTDEVRDILYASYVIREGIP